jgi:hypothetical protein
MTYATKGVAVEHEPRRLVQPVMRKTLTRTTSPTWRHATVLKSTALPQPWFHAFHGIVYNASYSYLVVSLPVSGCTSLGQALFVSLIGSLSVNKSRKIQDEYSTRETQR